MGTNWMERRQFVTGDGAMPNAPMTSGMSNGGFGFGGGGFGFGGGGFGFGGGNYQFGQAPGTFVGTVADIANGAGLAMQTFNMIGGAVGAGSRTVGTVMGAPSIARGTRNQFQTYDAGTETQRNYTRMARDESRVARGQQAQDNASGYGGGDGLSDQEERQIHRRERLDAKYARLAAKEKQLEERNQSGHGNIFTHMREHQLERKMGRVNGRLANLDEKLADVDAATNGRYQPASYAQQGQGGQGKGTNPQAVLQEFYAAMAQANTAKTPEEQKQLLARAQGSLDLLSADGKVYVPAHRMDIPTQGGKTAHFELQQPYTYGSSKEIMTEISASLAQQGVGNAIPEATITATLGDLNKALNPAAAATTPPAAANGQDASNKTTEPPPVPAFELPASDGAAAKLYNKVTGAPKIGGNQVDDVQGLLTKAGYDVGPKGVDNKWGKDTQAAFLKACADLKIDPAQVDFTAKDNALTKQLIDGLSAKISPKETATEKGTATPQVGGASTTVAGDREVANTTATTKFLDESREFMIKVGQYTPADGKGTNEEFLRAQEEKNKGHAGVVADGKLSTTELGLFAAEIDKAKAQVGLGEAFGQVPAGTGKKLAEVNTAMKAVLEQEHMVKNDGVYAVAAPAQPAPAANAQQPAAQPQPVATAQQPAAPTVQTPVAPAFVDASAARSNFLVEAVQALDFSGLSDRKVRQLEKDDGKLIAMLEEKYKGQPGVVADGKLDVNEVLLYGQAAQNSGMNGKETRQFGDAYAALTDELKSKGVTGGQTVNDVASAAGGKARSTEQGVGPRS